MLCLKLTVHFKDIWRPDGRGSALPWQHSSSKPPQSRNPPVLDWEPDGAIGLMTSRLPWQVLHQRVHQAPGGSTQRGRGSDPRLLHTAHVSGGGASGGGGAPWLGAITARLKCPIRQDRGALCLLQNIGTFTFSGAVKRVFKTDVFTWPPSELLLLSALIPSAMTSHRRDFILHYPSRQKAVRRPPPPAPPASRPPAPRRGPSVPCRVTVMAQ
ncbi:hypothetical protein EYF80_062798 [Liparis tanakae]|uniref:Uncharacterized protein n=1 Tax=Liparis tanakae TaxID=230148 RepID=A0A4Z2EDX6_9TELE|nr:hypothetical protein EYF80_062798 [Liparis tanakae]